MVGAIVDRAERAEAEFWATHARNVATSDETRDTGAVAVAGGYALCLQGTFLTYGLAVGSTRAVREDDLRIVDAFYATRNLPARLELHPSVVARDNDMLTSAGYKTEHRVAVLEREIDADSLTDTDVAIERVGGRRTEWIETVIEGFADSTAPVDLGRLRQATLACASASTALFLARIDGRPAGGGALGISGDAALLYSAAVLPAFRRRGIHSALLGARLTAARARGATYGFLKAVPASASLTSAERAGFRLSYERMRMRKA